MTEPTPAAAAAPDQTVWLTTGRAERRFAGPTALHYEIRVRAGDHPDAPVIYEGDIAGLLDMTLAAMLAAGEAEAGAQVEHAIRLQLAEAAAAIAPRLNAAVTDCLNWWATHQPDPAGAADV